MLLHYVYVHWQKEKFVSKYVILHVYTADVNLVYYVICFLLQNQHTQKEDLKCSLLLFFNTRTSAF